MTAKHPAKFSDEIINVIAREIPVGALVFDPFAGVGKIFDVIDWADWVGMEIEKEWADEHPLTICGDVFEDIPDWWEEFFDIICTSCLAQHERVLTEDLRWVPVGDISVGDRVMAFDENATSVKANETASRRRWRRAEVVRSIPRKRKCVRVILANGDEIITTPEHPWLTSRYSYGGTTMEWIPSCRLMGSTELGTTRGHRKEYRQPYHVKLQVAPWEPIRSYRTGWLAGIFNGEGSLSIGAYGSPNLQMCQVEGAVIDRTEKWLNRLIFETNRIVRKPHDKWQPPHRKPVHNLYITGGFPGIMRALGQLRPLRLLDKWLEADISTRTVEAQNIQVVAVEPAGAMDIQEIETDTGTYIGEGYLHHNCSYGNRLADHHNPKDGSTRHGYKFYLGRDLSPNNSAGIQWGDYYQAWHAGAWLAVLFTLRKGGKLILNVSNHIRGFEEQPVWEWHVNFLLQQGLNLQRIYPINTRRLREGKHYQTRVNCEYVFVFEK